MRGAPQSILLVAGLVIACGDAREPAGDDGPLAPPHVECSGLDCPPCASGSECAADASAYIDGSCCAPGDNLVRLATGSGAEVVDLESDDGLVVLCGGFGASVSEVSELAKPRLIGTAGRRCQRAAFGPVLADGARILYLSHHGDSWVPMPSLSTYVISADRSQLSELDAIEDPAILFEGLAYAAGIGAGHLYVATHGGGLRVYALGADGVPRSDAAAGSALTGLDNAWKVSIDGDWAYVADASGGLKVVSIADRLLPTIVQALPTTGLARDVQVHGDRVYVALGGSGVDVFDVVGEGQLIPRNNIATFGSAQAVDANDRLLAVANWDNVAIYDPVTLNLLGTEDLLPYPEFEQDLAIAILGDHILVGEWEGLHVLEYRPGMVGADIWIADELYQFSADEVGARAVVVRNRGPLELRISGISTSDDAFTVDASELIVAPGGAEVFELLYQPHAEAGASVLRLRTNDPDPAQSNLEIPLLSADTDEIDIGDSIGEDFAFLDPTGSGQLSNLDGRVVVLAYFALF